MLRPIRISASTLKPLPSMAKIIVCGTYPRAEPLKKLRLRAPDMPAKKLVMTLLPAGINLITNVVEKVFAIKKLSALSNRSENFI